MTDDSTRDAKTLELLDRRPITYSSATNTDKNIIRHLAALTKHHLGLGHQAICAVLPQREWLRGEFNVCIPVSVTLGTISRKFIFRCPMPHKLAEALHPGTIDEKLGYEVGTYAWMQDNCPDVRIPRLHGFGFSDNRHFTHERYRPWYIRIARVLQRCLYTLFQYPSLSQYIANPANHQLATGYMLLEYIDPDMGQMLSNIWNEQRHIPDRRRNLFHGLARLILSLARIPQSRIGSFQFQNDCSVTLTNRPLTCSMMIFENEGTPRTIQKTDTFLSTESFVSDMLMLHDNRFLSNENAVYDDEDCRGQMAIKTLLRALSHNYIKREYRNGPFLLQMTDLHASNIFVDDECNITCLVDLEWVCSLPIEMLAVPYWLTGCGIDEIHEERYDEFNRVRQEFMHIFNEEERKMTINYGVSPGRVINEMWDSKGVWFWYCIESVNGMLYLLGDHICPRFSIRLSPKIERILSELWSENSAEVVAKKVADLRRYNEELKKLFN